jgi:AraC-like DNA-binding protein
MFALGRNKRTLWAGIVAERLDYNPETARTLGRSVAGSSARAKARPLHHCVCRARGRIGSRPPALNAVKVRTAKAMLASGTMTAAEVARQVGCSSSTLYRHVRGGRTAVAAR